MSLEHGLIVAFAIVVLYGVGMTAFVIWLCKRQSDAIVAIA